MNKKKYMLLILLLLIVFNGYSIADATNALPIPISITSASAESFEIYFPYFNPAETSAKRKALRFEHDKLPLETFDIKYVDRIIQVPSYFAENVLLCMKSGFGVEFLSQKVYQPHAKGSVKMLIMQSKATESSMRSITYRTSSHKDIYMSLWGLQQLRKAMKDELDLVVTMCDYFSLSSHELLYSVPLYISLMSGSSTVLSTKGKFDFFLPQTHFEERLTEDFIGKIAQRMAQLLSVHERKFYNIASNKIKTIIAKAANAPVFGKQELVAALILMNRLYVVKKDSDYNYINNLNLSSFAMGCIVIANKLLNDWSLSNASWGRIFRVAKSDLNCIEREILSALDYNTFISEECYEMCNAGL